MGLRRRLRPAGAGRQRRARHSLPGGQQRWCPPGMRERAEGPENSFARARRNLPGFAEEGCRRGVSRLLPEDSLDREGLCLVRPHLVAVEALPGDAFPPARRLQVGSRRRKDEKLESRSGQRPAYSASSPRRWASKQAQAGANQPVRRKGEHPRERWGDPPRPGSWPRGSVDLRDTPAPGIRLSTAAAVEGTVADYNGLPFSANSTKTRTRRSKA